MWEKCSWEICGHFQEKFGSSEWNKCFVKIIAHTHIFVGEEEVKILGKRFAHRRGKLKGVKKKGSGIFMNIEYPSPLLTLSCFLGLSKFGLKNDTFARY